MDVGTTIEHSGSTSGIGDIPVEALIALGYPAPADAPSSDTPTQDAPGSPEASEPQSAPSPESTPATPTTEKPAPSSEAADWWKALEGVSDDELAQHPKFSGKIGAIAQKLNARDRAKAESDAALAQAAQAARAQAAELEALRYADSDEYIRREDELKAANTAKASVYAEVYAPARALFYELPDADQQALSGKSYPGLPAESVASYLRDIVERKSASAVAQARAEWEQSARGEIEKKVRRELTPAIRKDVLGELSDGAPRPDNNPGAGPVDLPMDSDAIRKMSIADYEHNRERYLGMFPTRR